MTPEQLDALLTEDLAALETEDYEAMGEIPERSAPAGARR